MTDTPHLPPCSSKSPINRADLLRLIARGGDQDRRDAWVRLCGYVPVVKDEEEAVGPAQPSTEVSPPISTQFPVDADRAREKVPLGFWRIVQVDFREAEAQQDVPDWFKQAKTITRASLRDTERPREDRPFPLLSPWSRLWPFLRRELSTRSLSHKVDTKALVKQMARYRPVRRIPRRVIRHWARSIHILCDTSPPLRTINKDITELIGRLKMICGRHRLTLYIFPHGPASDGY